jgi:hypothetical protein
MTLYCLLRAFILSCHIVTDFEFMYLLTDLYLFIH